MLAFLYSIHVLICVALIIVVLLQTGKGAGLASVFGSPGGGGADSLFGSKGFGGVLAKATGVLAVAFMVSSIGLSLFPKGARPVQDSVLDKLEGPAPGAPVEQSQPARMPGQEPGGEPGAEMDAPSEQPQESPAGQ